MHHGGIAIGDGGIDVPLTPPKHNNARRPGQVGGRLDVVRGAHQRMLVFPRFRRCVARCGEDHRRRDSLKLQGSAVKFVRCLRYRPTQFDVLVAASVDQGLTRWSGNYFVWVSRNSYQWPIPEGKTTPVTSDRRGCPYA